MDEFDKLGNRPNKARKVIPYAVLVIVVSIIVLLCCLPANFASAENEATAVFNRSSEIVIEQSTGRVLFGNGVRQKMEPASTTKILTAVCVLENCDDLEKTVTIPIEAASVEGSSIYLKAGEQWKTIDLLYGLMLRSGNDAAVALASIFGGIEKFAKIMNLTAIKCGAYESNFVNPHGLHHENHFTTAYDLAKITAYAYRNETFVKIVSSETHYYDYSGERRCFVNKNKMLKLFDGANGVKTGYTKNSGRCLVFGAERNGMQLISVVLNRSDMWQRSADIVEKCFSEYAMTKIMSKEDAKTVMIKGESVSVCVKRDLYYPLKESEKESLDISFTILSNAKNLSKGNEIGFVSIKITNHLIFNEKLFTI